ncbi:MAG: periplasmic heavy metal sensor [Acidobacteriota bacterium]
MSHKVKSLPVVVVMVMVVAVVSASGQTPQTQPAPSMPPRSAFVGDPIRQLNLTAEQREQIRLIREQNRDERVRINQRVRDADRALEEALEGDHPDEATVEQRLREAAAAQAAAMRMRILSEVKIRRVLTQEQRILLRTLRRRAHEVREGRRIEGLEERQNRRDERSLRLRERRKNTGPLLPARDRQRRSIP